VARGVSGVSHFQCADSLAAVICGGFDHHSLFSTQNSSVRTRRKNLKLKGGFLKNGIRLFLNCLDGTQKSLIPAWDFNWQAMFRYLSPLGVVSPIHNFHALSL
jgi:hypothetical protein